MRSEHYLKDVPDSDQRPDTVSHVIGSVRQSSEAGRQDLQRSEHSLDLIALITIVNNIISDITLTQ